MGLKSWWWSSSSSSSILLLLLLLLFMFYPIIIHASSLIINEWNTDTTCPAAAQDFMVATASSSSHSSYLCEFAANYEGSRNPSDTFTFTQKYPSIAQEYDTASLNRSSFPPNFMFGTASSAYQYEGAANEGGRAPSIWDTYTEKYPYKIEDHSTGAIAVDSYHRFKEDVHIMENIGFNSYRFSISWPRLLPGGNLRGGVNKEGIKYYNSLIDELLSKGIQPFVTIFHWDVPQSLEDAYGGFLGPQIVKDFTDFAEVCFKEFGDRVKHWITLNGPTIFSDLGYARGMKAPGRCSNWLPFNCTTSADSSTEPYIVAHHLLLAHASAVNLYRKNYQKSQKGQIGLAESIVWILPMSQSVDDIDAASRALAFNLDWFIGPLNTGSYPDEMVKYVGDRLPKFSQHQSNLVKGSFDFIGINYYTTMYAQNIECPTHNRAYSTDFCANLTYEQNGVPIGPKTPASHWIHFYPKGLLELLLHMKNKYNNPVIYITENGYDEVNDGTISLHDKERIDWHFHHLSYIHSALLNGVKVKGYFVWSLLDNFEWANGYTSRFGIVYVDYMDGLKRYPKHSAKWFKKFLHQSQ